MWFSRVCECIEISRGVVMCSLIPAGDSVAVNNSGDCDFRGEGWRGFRRFWRECEHCGDYHGGGVMIDCEKLLAGMGCT